MSLPLPDFGNPQPSLLTRWLREPLLHFLLAGAALFALYRALHPAADAPATPRRIELTGDDLRQLDADWTTQYHRRPTPEEMLGLVDARIREEILYREALVLGLDQGDALVKQRLAEKMDFLAEDADAAGEPQPSELKTWFAANAARFALPARITFRHLYFSPEKRGTQAREAAVHALEALSGKPADAPEAAGLADRFAFLDSYRDRALEQIANVFGNPFAESLFKLEPGAWRGPIESGLGWHLVWVDSLTPERLPAFEETDPALVQSEWIADQRAEAKRRAFEALKARYEIVLPDGWPSADSGAADRGGSPTAKESP